MDKKKHLIIVGTWQFGPGTQGRDIFCKNIADEYDVSYICFDEHKIKAEIPSNVEVDYIEENQNRLWRKIRFIKTINKRINEHRNSVVYVVYFRFCCLLQILHPFRRIIVFFESGNINPNVLNRNIKNTLMRFEALFFRYIFAISEELKQHLHLPKRTGIFPLGAEAISTTGKTFDKLQLLYVGTLQGRHIHETIYGVAQFMKKYPNVLTEYNIIGKGDNSLIMSEIKKYNLENVVKLLGFVPNEEIVPYYDKSNTGICYAPMSVYYMPQPFTKLYEYGMSGMASISVKLTDSVKRVNDKIGVLCEDNPQSFAEALEKIYLNRSNFDSSYIRNYFAPYTWTNISKQFKAIIDG